ncbi:MAG: HDIG domain-containing protein [Cyanobacteria bacterium SZAS LIN-3]|nr:HDIG domain-containing protein [Cyanobacteria bacterium SZAS LIN-3]
MSGTFRPGHHPLDCVLARDVFDFGRRQQVQLYLVGGFVRDCLRQGDGPSPVETVRDLDFAVLGMPAMQFGQLVAEQFKGHYVPLDEINDVSRVVIDNGPTLDFAGCQGGSLAADIQRRDFTVNAMALDPDRPDELIDPTGGLADLRAGIIRAVSPQVLTEDPLRLLRAYRFACLLGFVIEPATLEHIRANIQLLPTVARERINYELFTLLDCPDVGRLVHEMGEIGLFEAIFAELVATRKVTANSFHHLPLFVHSLETIPQLEARLPSLPDFARESLSQELTPAVSRLAATKVAAILHDIGKPDTWQITEEGRHTFIGHDKLGATMIRETAETQKWPRALGRMVERLVLWHLRPGQLFHTGEPTQKALNRFYRTVGDDVPELMLLSFGDLGATRGPGLTGPDRERLEKRLIDLLNGYAVYKEECKKLPKLLTGSELMKLLGIAPGPLVGEILNALAEAQELKEVRDRSQAEAFARSYYAANQVQI